MQGPPPQYAEKSSLETQSFDDVNFEGSAKARSEQNKAENDAEIFQNVPAFNDLWASIAFFINFVAFVGLSAYGFNSLYTKLETSNSAETIRITPEDGQMMIRTLPTTIAFTALALICYLYVAYKHSSCLIITTVLVNGLIFLALSVVMFMIRQTFSGIVWLILALISPLFIYCVRDRIAFAAVMLNNVLWVVARYPSMVVAGFLAIVAQAIVFLVWVGGLMGLAVHWKGTGPEIALLIYYVFILYWVTQVVKNIVHTTNCGVFASYYYLYGDPKFENKSPILGSARRALTWSFGSICFGSLIVAVLKTLRFCVQAFCRDGYLACFGYCILACLENIARYFNHYAYTQVAIYGKSFVRAGKDTWSLFKRCGLEALINDDLIAYVLFFGMLFVSLLSFGFAWAIASLGNTVTPSNNFQWILAGAACAFGMLSMCTIAGVIESGTATIFVCFAEDPEALLRSKPDLYGKMVEANTAAIAKAEKKRQQKKC